MMVRFLTLAAAAAVAMAAVAVPDPTPDRPWPGANSSTGVHLFTLWSQEATENVADFDFVWAIQNAAELQRFRAAGVAAGRSTPAVLGRYVPFGIAAAGTGASNQNYKNLSWWQHHHPSWVLYTCDRKTPATYWGPGIGLDISSPAVLDWMLHADAAEHSLSAASILAGGYDAVSLDLFSFGNWFRACGRWEGTTWVQMYTGSTSDSGYKADVLRWVRAYHDGLISMAWFGLSANRLLLVPNHASHIGQVTTGFWGDDAWNSSETFWVGNHTDAILSEEGWTGYGGGLVADDDWTNKRLLQANLERHGKGYLSVNYWGPNSTRTHLPVPGSSFILAEDYFLASHLIGNRGRAAVYYGPNQCVDGVLGRCTCASWCTRGVFARNVTPAVGAPLGAAANIDGLWRREFRSGIALVNPSSTHLVSAVLDPSWSWRRRDGSEVDTAFSLKLPPTTGAVLTRHARRGSAV